MSGVNKRLFVEGMHGITMYPVPVGKEKIGNQLITVAEVPKKLKYGVIGVNKLAAKPYGIDTNIPENTIIVWKGQGAKTKEHTIWHEGVEKHCMKCGKLPYIIAHRIALKFEDTEVTPREALAWYKENRRYLGKYWKARR